MRLPELYLSAEQVKVLASGFRVDLVYAFRLYGPASIPELAPKLNRDQDSLYHHVRKLLAAGVLQEVEKRKRSTKTEAVYDTVADRLRLKPKPWDEEYAELAMKLFETDFRMGLEHCRDAVETYHGSSELNEMQYVRRMPVRLSAAKLKEFKKKLVELDAWVTEAAKEREGQAISILIAVNPLTR
jgi:predicted transcriptional regulator